MSLVCWDTDSNVLRLSTAELSSNGGYMGLKPKLVVPTLSAGSRERHPLPEVVEGP